MIVQKHWFFSHTDLINFSYNKISVLSIKKLNVLRVENTAEISKTAKMANGLRAYQYSFATKHAQNGSFKLGQNSKSQKKGKKSFICAFNDIFNVHTYMHFMWKLSGILGSNVYSSTLWSVIENRISSQVIASP